MRHSLTYASLFMHGEPEPSYSLRLFSDADRFSLKEMETMERLHQEIALKRQMQQEDSSSRPYTCAKRPCSNQPSAIAAEFREFGATLPQHDETLDDLLIGAARRLNHIIDDRRISWRVIPTAINKQYPTSEYLYPTKGEAYRMHTPPSAQNRTFTVVRNDAGDSSSLSPGTSFLRTQRSNALKCCKENASHIHGCTPKSKDGLEFRKSAPLLVVTSPKATQLNRLSIQSPARLSTRTPSTPPTSRAFRSKSLKSMSAWMETLPSIADVERVISSTPAYKTPRLEMDFGTISSLTELSDEAKNLALSPGTSCTLTLSTECAPQQTSK